MIPNFNQDGYLPKGIHKANIEEIEEKFGGGSVKREELFKNVLLIRNLLIKHKGNISRFILNGSFVSSREEPGDFDYILILKDGFDLDSEEAMQLFCSDELFNANMLFAMEQDRVECQRIIEFFGHDKEGKSKGLVEVIL